MIISLCCVQIVRLKFLSCVFFQIKSIALLVCLSLLKVNAKPFALCYVSYNTDGRERRSLRLRFGLAALLTF